MIPHPAVDWTQVFIALLALNALIAAALKLTGVLSSPHPGRHTRQAILSRPQAVDETQPVRVAPRALDRAGVA